MQAAPVTVEMLFQVHEQILHWRWVSGRCWAQKVINPQAVQQAMSSSDLVGYLNFLHPHRIQVLGEKEIHYLQSLNDSKCRDFLDGAIIEQTPAVIVASGCCVSDRIKQVCEDKAVPLLASNTHAADVINALLAWIAKRFAVHVDVHGVFMDVFGIGVLIIGEAGLGKSELGLELISRGHRLIADDVVDFYLVAHNIVIGCCSPLLQNLMEVRGIGLLDIHSLFGEMSVRPKMQLSLVVQLIPRDIFDQRFERLPTQVQEQEVLGVKIRKAIIPVEAGRNIAVLAEAAVRNTILNMRGIDSMAEFVVRHQKAMKTNNSNAMGKNILDK